MQPKIKRILETGSNERRFPASRRTQHGKKSGGGKPIDHCIDAAFSSEEKIRLVACESPKTRIGETLHRHCLLN
jgi:hypothetical protein